MLPGQKIRLKCPTIAPWLLCVWQSPTLGKMCILKIGKKYSEVCDNHENKTDVSRYVVFVSSHSCDISFHASSEDHGVWSCMLTSTSDKSRLQDPC